jgi:hypothetical protein
MVELLWGIFQLFLDRTAVDSSHVVDVAGKAIVELKRVTHARGDARKLAGDKKRAEATERRRRGELIKNIASDMDLSERRVLELIPPELKQQR